MIEETDLVALAFRSVLEAAHLGAQERHSAIERKSDSHGARSRVYIEVVAVEFIPVRHLERSAATHRSFPEVHSEFKALGADGLDRGAYGAISHRR